MSSGSPLWTTPEDPRSKLAVFKCQTSISECEQAFVHKNESLLTLNRSAWATNSCVCMHVWMCIFLTFLIGPLADWQRVSDDLWRCHSRTVKAFWYALELSPVLAHVSFFTQCFLTYVYVHADVIHVWRAWDLLEGGEESVKVLVTIGHEQDVQAGPWAANRRRSAVPTETTNHSRVDAVAVSDLHIVVMTRVVGFQAEHHEPVIKETSLISVMNAEFYHSFKLWALLNLKSPFIIMS